MKLGTSDDRPTPDARHTRSTLVVGGFVLAAVLSTRWVRLNTSPSVPLGLYRLAPVSTPLTRGTLVVLPVPASVHPWQHMPLLKPVAGVPGDAVCVRAAALTINGVDYGPVLHEAAGKPLPWHPGCHLIPDGAVFLASQAPRSLDSRYFGPVPVTSLTATADPLWTWR